MAITAETLWAWHAGQRALIFIDPEPMPNGQRAAFAFGPKALASSGWKCEASEMAKTLPRFDSQIQMAGSAADIARAAAEVDQLRRVMMPRR